MMNVKDVKRLEEILKVFAQRGFSFYLKKSRLNRFLSITNKIRCRFSKECKCEEGSLPVKFRESLEELGPTFVKLGQLLSVRPDFIPYEYCNELRKLQDAVPQFPYSQVKSIIKEEFGRPINQIFSYFNENPIASASIAQVHEAKLKDGRKVAVKVQRPSVSKTIEEDIHLLRWAASFIEKHWEASRIFRPQKLVEEFADWTNRELDFRNEAKSMSEIRNDMKSNRSIVIPNVYWETTGKRVLTMDLIEGVKIYDENGLKKLGVSKKEIAIRGAEAMFQQSMVYGLFHADPHPGNLLALRGNKIAFLDFGIVGRLTPHARRKMLLVIKNMLDEDFEKAIDHMMDFGTVSEDSEVKEYRRQLYTIFSSWYGSTLSQNSLSQTIFKGINQSVHYKVYFPVDLVLYAKALVTIESVGMMLYPGFDISVHAKPFMQSIAKKQLSPVKSLRNFAKNSIEYSHLIENIPIYADRLIKKLEQPEHKIKINVDEFIQMKDEVHQMNKMRTFGVIIASLILSSAILLYLEGITKVFGVSFGLIFLYVAIILSLFMIRIMLLKMK